MSRRFRDDGALVALLLAIFACAWVDLMASLATIRALRDLRPGGVAAVVGLPGSGKSEATKAAAVGWSRRVVFEPFAIRDRLEAARGGGHRRPWGGELVTVEGLLRRPALLDRRPLALVVAPADPGAANMGRDFGAVARLAWRTGGLILIGEEAGLYSRNATEAINLVASGGAHARMSLVLLCQSLGRIQKDARRNLSLVAAGAQSEEDDFAALRRRCGADFARQVRTLRPALFDARDRLVRPPDPLAIWSQGSAL